MDNDDDGKNDADDNNMDGDRSGGDDNDNRVAMMIKNQCIYELIITIID